MRSRQHTVRMDLTLSLPRRDVLPVIFDNKEKRNVLITFQLLRLAAERSAHRPFLCNLDTDSSLSDGSVIAEQDPVISTNQDKEKEVVFLKSLPLSCRSHRSSQQIIRPKIPVPSILHPYSNFLLLILHSKQWFWSRGFSNLDKFNFKCIELTPINVIFYKWLKSITSNNTTFKNRKWKCNCIIIP